MERASKSLPATFARLAWLLQDGHLAQCPVCRGDCGYADLGASAADCAAVYDSWDQRSYGRCAVCAAEVEVDPITGDVEPLDTVALRPGVPAELVAAYAAAYPAPRRGGPSVAEVVAARRRLASLVADYEGLEVAAQEVAA